MRLTSEREAEIRNAHKKDWLGTMAEELLAELDAVRAERDSAQKWNRDSMGDHPYSNCPQNYGEHYSDRCDCALVFKKQRDEALNTVKFQLLMVKQAEESARLHALGAERELKLMTQLSVERKYSGKLREAIQRVHDDDETGHWGPDVTMKGILAQALALPMPEEKKG